MSKKTFTSPYAPANHGDGVAPEDKITHALDYIAHYLGQIEQHLSALASNANQPQLSEVKRRIIASVGSSQAPSRKLETQE
jgi:hypothetical protein